MPVHICKTCGTSFPEMPTPPTQCPICEDERQFVPRRRQQWTTPQELAEDHVNGWARLEPDLFQIQTHPGFAIGQRALLVRTPQDNILWDCVALIDDATIELVHGLGGLRAIAISHPHYYTTCQDWARAFNCRVHLHAADREWLMRPDPAVQFWEGESSMLAKGVTLVRLGGHYPGGTVLHWAAGANGQGALLSGDILQVAMDTRRVSFMWSYPNMMPLSERIVRRIADTAAAWRFERIYGAFPGRDVMADGNAAVERSAKRYVDLLNDR
ncbi:MBL fold metallo-hydrolase [Bradyrhizobium sp.]|jgi:glyoxylase-like metal-dependent hydrolase (beta-lactamase superfamily II)|uniref:MBL fold metallo-hydrolase n=1 Tax=Bradyrhizobium sp. TaxID=376 RepID=UPI003C23DE74